MSAKQPSEATFHGNTNIHENKVNVGKYSSDY